MDKISCVSIVVSGGKGLRMGGNVKKQFIDIDNECIIVSTLKAISKSEYIDKIILVVGSEDIEFSKKLVKENSISKVKKIVAGGNTRSESVKNGLLNVEKCDVVAIHDGVRPLVSQKSIDECINNAFIYGASALGVAPKDTIKVKNKDFIDKTIDRDSLVIIQTPQCFKYDIIKKAYENFNPDFTDDCMQVESMGYKIHITQGEYKNIKITTKSDLVLFKALKKGKGEDEIWE